MTTMIPRDLPLPEDCRVRLVDLPVQAGGVIAVDEDGFVNIYLNARLSRDAQRRALVHELRHHYRGDLYSDQDIRAVEQAVAGLTAIDGAPLDSPPPFDSEGFARVGRGLYLPTGANLARMAAMLDRVKALLGEACQIYDVMQTPPLLPAAALRASADALGPGDIAFVAFQPKGERCPSALHFSREDLYGALYFAPDGAPDNALAVLCAGEARVTVDMRRRKGRLDTCGITREIGDQYEKIY